MTSPRSPSPALVAQSAVRRLPRSALVMLCAAYVLAGFLGRDPWKNADMASFGYMLALARGLTDWWHPLLGGLPTESDGLLGYWLGAWAIRASAFTSALGWLGLPALPVDFAARIPFMVLLPATLWLSWQAVVQLASQPQAQPVAFAFGGEAHPKDYARTLADGALLALLACLGLAQLGHETTAYLCQLCSTAGLFYAASSLASASKAGWQPLGPLVGFQFALLALALSGAPSVALALGLLSAGVVALKRETSVTSALSASPLRLPLFMVLISLGVFAFSWGLGLFTWRVLNPFYAFQANGILRLLVWFGWPAWPLALWSLWRWRHQLSHWRWPTHLAMPLGFVAISLFSACTTQPADRALLLGLPALCALASFALPTLNRRLSALIDWFTLLFFALLALLIWFYWFAAVTGSPAAAAAAVARRTPGFTPHWVWQEFCLALVATLAYAWLLAWRIGRHRSALWKSLVLPAGGTVLAWVLFMTLWLPALNYALSYEPMVKQARQWMGLPSQTNQTQCVEQDGLTRAQIAAFQYYAPLRLVPVQDNPERSPPSDLMGFSCAWRLTSLSHVVDSPEWQSVGLLQRPTDRFDQLVLFRRKVPTAPVYAAASAPL